MGNQNGPSSLQGAECTCLSPRWSRVTVGRIHSGPILEPFPSEAKGGARTLQGATELKQGVSFFQTSGVSCCHCCCLLLLAACLLGAQAHSTDPTFRQTSSSTYYVFQHGELEHNPKKMASSRWYHNSTSSTYALEVVLSKRTFIFAGFGACCLPSCSTFLSFRIACCLLLLRLEILYATG